MLAGEHLEELVLALRLERRDAEDLARPERERDVGERLADLQPAHLERRSAVRDLDPLARRRRLGALGGAGDLLAEHELDDLLLAALPRHERADVAAVAEHGRAVAVRDHLAEAVGDEERRAAALLLAPHHVEDALGEVGRKRGGDLVQDQQLRVARERAGEVEHPQQRQRHVDRLLAEVDLEVELAQLPAHLCDGRPRQAQVLRDRSGRARAPGPGRRARARSAPPARASETRMALPSTRIVPPSGRITPVRIFTSVLLPAPFAPSSACTSPGSTTSVADRSATTGP